MVMIMDYTEMKCSECEGDIVVTCTQHDRYFYFDERGLLHEDDNWKLMEPDTLIVHCSNDREHDWKSGKDQEKVVQYEDALLNLIRAKFFRSNIDERTTGYTGDETKDKYPY